MKLTPEAVEEKVVYSALRQAIFAHFKRMGEFTPGLTLFRDRLLAIAQ